MRVDQRPQHYDIISGDPTPPPPEPPPKKPVQWTRFPKDKKRKAK